MGLSCCYVLDPHSSFFIIRFFSAKCWQNSASIDAGKQNKNKKVLLRERKRHTACRVASARYAGGGGVVPRPVMVGVPHPVMVGGVTHPVMVRGTPSSHGGGGVPPTIQTWPGGYPRYPHHSDLARRVPQVPPPMQTFPGGTPGTPAPSRPGWGAPQVSPHHPDLARGGTPGTPPLPFRPGHGGYPRYPPTIQTWDGVPHHPDLAGGVPWVPPTIQTWPGGVPRYSPHHPDLGWGTPHHPDLGWGTPHHPDLGQSTLSPKFEQTHTCENITFHCMYYVRGQ